MIALLAIASAWEIIEASPYVWTEFPIVLTPHDLEAEGLAAGQTLAAIDAAAALWNGIECTAPLALQLDPPSPLDHTFDLGDTRNHVAVGDPDNSLEAGVIAAALVQRFGLAYELDGQALEVADNGDIALNDNITFATRAQIAAGGCTDAYDAEAYLAHEVGHLLGLGHSETSTAMMSYFAGVCGDVTTQLDDDDRAGIQALYAFGYTLSCDPIATTVPATVGCELLLGLDGPDPSVTWQFGDGATEAGLTVSHAFAQRGAYPIEACATKVGCPDTWCDTVEIAVCGPIVPRLDVEATADARIVRLLNDTEIDAAGCLTDILWTVTDAGGEFVTSDARWEPIVLLPEPGVYEATVLITGVAGEATETLRFDTRKLEPPTPSRSGCGCSNTTTSSTAPWLLALALLIRPARRSAGRGRTMSTANAPTRPAPTRP